MPRTEQFDRFAKRYDEWFSSHWGAFESELAALRKFVPSKGTGMEVGMGTGRFAQALDVSIGVEPSEGMREIARRRGLNAIGGAAENLPFASSLFDFVLMINVLCFFDDPGMALKEAHRVLRPGGLLILALIDRENALGREYARRKDEESLYRDARLFSVPEAALLAGKAGFTELAFAQSITNGLDMAVPEEPLDGYGKGAFVVIRAKKG